MHPDPIVRALHTCALAQVPICLWSPPGAGKTARVRSYVTALGLPHVRWLLSRCEPIDLKPRVYDGGTVVVSDPPEIKTLMGLAAPVERMPRGVLFLDELNRATREVEGAALDRIDAPPQAVAVVAACNPPSRGQAARSLESAAANRFCHVSVASDPTAYASALIGGWPSEPGAFRGIGDALWQKCHDQVSAILSAFIRSKPDALEKQPDNPVDAGRAWPSARTWEYVRLVHTARLAQAVGETPSGGHPDDSARQAAETRLVGDLLMLVGGCIGEGLATEYLAFVASADLPDPDVLLANPGAYTPPAGRIDRTIAAISAVTSAVERDLTRERWQAAWQIAERCLSAEQADAAMVMGDLLVSLYRRASQAAQARGEATGRPNGGPDAARAFEKELGPMHRHIPDRLAQILSPKSP